MMNHHQPKDDKPRQVERSLEEMEALLGRSGPDYRQVLHNALTLMMMMMRRTMMRRRMTINNLDH